MIGLLMNNELEWIWKELAMARFKFLSQHLLGGTEESHKNLSQMEI
jgi:hypothetical protein